MRNTSRQFFVQATKSKVIIGFLLAGMALLTAWGISNFVFKEMLVTVDQLSSPNDKLLIVSRLSEKISRLDQVQRNKAFNNALQYDSFFKESKEIKLSLDTLINLYKKDETQMARLKSLKKLVSDRDQQFIKYLKVRDNLINTTSLSEEVEKLTELVKNNDWPTDSAVTTEKKTTTTTVVPTEIKSKGLLNKLFGKRNTEAYKIIEEQLQIKTDKLNSVSEDSLSNKIGIALVNLEKEQQEKSNKFINEEADLNTASNQLTLQMLKILKDVESEVLAKAGLNGANAKQVLKEGIQQTTKVLIVFLILTLILLYVILSDISKSNRYRLALEKTKEEAEHHAEAKQRFLSNISHEIRTPLQSIIGYSEQLMLHGSNNKKEVDAIQRSSNHLLSIVNEVLDYNKINSGEFKIHPQVFNMMDVLQEVRTAIQPLATNKSLDLSTDFELDEHLTAYGDAFRLKQILFNLLGNAIKFTSKGSVTLKVAYKSYKNHLHFSFLIKDTGIGMNEKDLAHIFNEFEQAENTQHYINNQAGTGLGLSIVKRLVEKQLGRVSAKSKPGQGTTFSVFLKFEKVEATENKIKINQQIQLPDQLKIWIVDDDRFILDLCEMIFNNHHIAFESFNNASEILSAQPNPQLSHVLVDMRLPDKSGLEVCQILKEKLPAHIEFYAITAHVLKEEQENILTQGFKGIIMKPFKEQELLDIFINTTHDLKVPRFDFTALRKMTFDDEKQLKKIWLRFKQDCEDDSKQLQKSIMEEDVATARLVVHRLAGRLSQIGAKEIGNELRKKEIRIEQENELSDETKSAIKILMDHVYQLTLHEPV